MYGSCGSSGSVAAVSVGIIDGKAILNGIITPARMKANEAYMYEVADNVIDEFIDDGKFFFVRYRIGEKLLNVYCHGDADRF